MAFFRKIISSYNTIDIYAILYPTSLASWKLGIVMRSYLFNTLTTAISQAAFSNAFS